MATDVDWYVKRTVLGAIYSTTEVYMLTDSSPGLFSLLFSYSRKTDLPSGLSHSAPILPNGGLD